MDTANQLATLTAAVVLSFATALLLNWAMLQALFHLLPRTMEIRTGKESGRSKQRPYGARLQLHVLPTPPGEAPQEPGREASARPGSVYRVGPEPGRAA